MKIALCGIRCSQVLCTDYARFYRFIITLQGFIILFLTQVQIAEEESADCLVGILWRECCLGHRNRFGIIICYTPTEERVAADTCKKIWINGCQQLPFTQRCRGLFESFLPCSEI